MIYKITKRLITESNYIILDKDKIVTYNLIKFQGSNMSTCLNQKPLVRRGDIVNAGDIIDLELICEIYTDDLVPLACSLATLLLNPKLSLTVSYLLVI